MEKKIKVSLTEDEADALWSCLTGEIIKCIEEDKTWKQKYPFYDFLKELRDKIDFEKHINK